MDHYVADGGTRAVKNLKDVLTAWNYHRTPAINTILVNQVQRVGNMLNQMETYLAGRDIAYGRQGNLVRYVPIGLQTKWRIFMQQRVTLARTKADTHMTTWLNKLKDGYTSQLQRASTDPDMVTLIGKIDALDAAITGKAAWNLPVF